MCNKIYIDNCRLDLVIDGVEGQYCRAMTNDESGDLLHQFAAELFIPITRFKKKGDHKNSRDYYPIEAEEILDAYNQKLIDKYDIEFVYHGSEPWRKG